MGQASAPGAGSGRDDNGPAPRQPEQTGDDGSRWQSTLPDGDGAAPIGEPAVKTDRTLQASYRFCGAVATPRHGTSTTPSWLLPRERRRSMCALYAFLRHTDDLADEPGSAAEKARALEAWRQALDAAARPAPAASAPRTLRP